MGVAVQIVTSAVREIPKAWGKIDNLYIVVSIDGLQPEHDERRKPATYERIIRNIEGQLITVHCTVTSQMTTRQGYLEDFLRFWSERPEVKRVWFSLFTPQIGATDQEILDPETRAVVIESIRALKGKYPKLDMPRLVLEGYKKPPASPADCIFSRTTLNLTANLEDKVVPCQFGGTPDCSNCGCMASAGLAAVGEYKLGGMVKLRNVYDLSDRIGTGIRRILS